MEQITCSRCGSLANGLENCPLPGSHGALVLEQTCGNCWNEWKEMQVKLINEYRLDVLEPGHFDRLMQEMRTFLNLSEDGPTDG
jgi:Fe-S cluster biosynthesis and repair protein YggX